MCAYVIVESPGLNVRMRAPDGAANCARGLVIALSYRGVVGRIPTPRSAEVKYDPVRAGQTLVYALICFGHGCRGKSAHDFLSAGGAIDLGESADRGDQGVFGVADEPRCSVANHLGDTARPQRQNRSPTRERLNHHQSKWLGPPDREQERGCIAQEIVFLEAVDFSDQFHTFAQ